MVAQLLAVPVAVLSAWQPARWLVGLARCGVLKRQRDSWSSAPQGPAAGRRRGLRGGPLPPGHRRRLHPPGRPVHPPALQVPTAPASFLGFTPVQARLLPPLRGLRCACAAVPAAAAPRRLAAQDCSWHPQPVARAGRSLSCTHAAACIVNMLRPAPVSLQGRPAAEDGVQRPGGGRQARLPEPRLHAAGVAGRAGPGARCLAVFPPSCPC